MRSLRPGLRLALVGALVGLVSLAPAVSADVDLSRIEVVVSITGAEQIPALGAGATLTYTARYPASGSYAAESVFAVVFADSAQLEIRGAASSELDGTYVPVDTPYYAFATIGTVDFPTYSTRVGGTIEFATPLGALTLDIQVPGTANPSAGAPIALADFANAPPDTLGTTAVQLSGTGGGSDGQIDVTVASRIEPDALPAPDHLYELAGSYADELGGPDLIPRGGTLGPTGYAFEPGQGLDLVGAVDPETYSIEMVLRISDDVDPYRKLIDFADLASDAGLYVYLGGLRFYPDAAGPTGILAPDRTATVLLSRDGTTKVVRGSVDGRLQWAFIDAADAVFGAPDAIVRLLQDDDITMGAEAAAGFVDRIRVWNQVVPEPAPRLSGAGALLALGALSRRRRGGIGGRIRAGPRAARRGGA